MRKRLTLSLLTIVCALLFALAFVACGEGGTDGGKTDPPTTHEHTMEFHPQQDFTCKEDGNVAYWSCAGCGKYFSDEAGKTEITDKTSVILPAAHTYGELTEKYPATCTENGLKEGTCSKCGEHVTEPIPATGHEYSEEFETIVAPTCTNDGVSAIVCKHCGDQKETKPIPAAHTLGEFAVVNEPTCTREGSKRRTCTRCNNYADWEVIPALGHLFENSTVNREATCTEDGEKIYYCTRANCFEHKTEPIPATGHTYCEFTVIEQPTCTQEGLQRRICTVCGTVDQESVPVTEHTYAEIWNKNSAEHWHACTQCGAKKDVAAHTFSGNACSVCGRTKVTQGLAFQKVSNGYAVAGIGTATDRDIIIPEEYEDLPVVEISSRAFSGCSEITSIEIPHSVLKLRIYAFENCTGLKELVIPDSVTNIQLGVLSGCSSLRKLTIPFIGVVKRPDSLYKYPLGNIFGDVNYETSVGIEQAYIDNGKDRTCIYYFPSTLQSLTVTGGSIPASAYRSSYPGSAQNFFSYFTHVEFGDEVTEIEGSVFCDCTKLQTARLPDRLTEIGNAMFSECTSLTQVNVPSRITKIGDSAFYNCRELTAITLPDGVESIGYAAFEGCAKLEKLHIPGSVTEIGESPFVGCDSLAALTVDKSNANFCEINGILLSENATEIICVPQMLKGKLVIPEGVTNIPELSGAHPNVTEVVFPDSVQTVARWALIGFTSIESLTLPFVGTNDNGDLRATHLSWLFHAAPSNSDPHENFTVPASLKKITVTKYVSSSAFRNCTDITTVVIQNAATIGDCAFA